MVRVDSKYCKDCGKKTLHNYVGSKNEFAELGPVIRSVLAVASLGMTETLGKQNYWQCTKCGRVKKSDAV